MTIKAEQTILLKSILNLGFEDFKHWICRLTVMEDSDDNILITVLNQYFFAYGEDNMSKIAGEGVY